MNKVPLADESATATTPPPRKKLKSDEIKLEEDSTSTPSTCQLNSQSNQLKAEKSRSDEEIFPAQNQPINWTTVKRDNLNISYCRLFSAKTASVIFKRLEEEIEYFQGDLATVKVFGKVYNVPRKVSAYGDVGLTYRYSGTTVPAKPWTPTLKRVKLLLQDQVGLEFNFVLVNRYKDGLDKMGFHKDDEKELVAEAPIASISLGAERDFIFRHDRKKGSKVADECLSLQHGSLLLMHPPTNQHWYHSLPERKKCALPRINLTFRRISLPLSAKK